MATRHINEHSDWYYKFVFGDKSTFHLAWAKCGTCGFDYPITKIRRHPRWGYQCTTLCWDGLFDREEAIKMRRFPLGEGVRRTPAPITNTVLVKDIFSGTSGVVCLPRSAVRSTQVRG
jgi:hypothetical protein